jgi:hypothetical protein
LYSGKFADSKVGEGERKKMAKQFGKYILRPGTGQKAGEKTSNVKPVVLEGDKDWGGIQHRMKWSFVTGPAVMEEKPHSHDFDEFLCFHSVSPEDEYDFNANIELSMGKEGEKQVIQTPTVVVIPKGGGTRSPCL